MEDSHLEVVTFSSPEGRDVYRHSSAHLMAQAVKILFPGVKLAIGPPIEDGFYYDFDSERPFTPADLGEIEKKMQELSKVDIPISRKELSKEEALTLFEKRGEPLKGELIQGLETEKVSIYQQGDFVDLCHGPHLPSTGWIKAIKLLSSANAYWRGDERRERLQRIYGTSFPSQSELEEYLTRLEEIKRRDHRKLGRDLDLFSIHEAIGPGLILWHPKGALIRKLIEDFWREEHLKRGYDLVSTPHIAPLDLWKRSGHLEFYKDNMYSPMEVEGALYQLKPMNCPFHVMIYKSQLRSYRDLPLRFAELGTVYRYERSGVLHGLMRVRGFTQDDAHILCRPDQLEEEIGGVLDFTLSMLRVFGFKDFELYLSTRPEKAVGSQEDWERASAALQSALKGRGLFYHIDPGEGVFYGPKIDVKITDSLGRAWQCATTQVDFNLPERFETTYIGEDGREHRPIMVHRALLGSLERFVGILIEHYAGAFPLWLAPYQVKVIPITERQGEYAQSVVQFLKEEGIRADCDSRSEKVGFKIREAERAKIPYMLIVGEKEMTRSTVSVRKRNGGDLGERGLSSFVALLKAEIQEKSAK